MQGERARIMVCVLGWPPQIMARRLRLEEGPCPLLMTPLLRLTMMMLLGAALKQLRFEGSTVTQFALGLQTETPLSALMDRLVVSTPPLHLMTRPCLLLTSTGTLSFL